MKHGGDIYSDSIEYDFSVNLNPVDCQKIVREILDDSADKLSHYPDMEQRAFRNAISIVEGVKPDEIWGGNGASEILMALVTMIHPQKVMLMNPCFNGYRHALERLDECEVVEYNLCDETDFVPSNHFIRALEYEAGKGLDLLIMTNPNNPTGRLVSEEIAMAIFEVCRRYGIRFIVDECFIRMSSVGYSMTKYIKEYEGLFVVNAYTKLFSIPGIRLGYVVSDSKNIQAVKKYLPEWNLSVIAQSAGVICSRYLADETWLMEVQKEIEKERAFLNQELAKLKVKVYQSDTGYLLMKTNDKIYDYLLYHKILIRDCSDYKGLGEGYYRIAVKSHKENEILIQTLKMRT